MNLPIRLQSAIDQALQRGYSCRLSSALHPFLLPLYVDDANHEPMRHAIDITSLKSTLLGNGCMLQVRDMSESYRRETLLRQQAQRLQNSEQRLSTTLDSAPIGMALATLDGRWTYVNQSLCAMVGQSAEALIGSAAREHVDPMDHAVHAQFEQQLQGLQHASAQVQVRWMHGLGHCVWVRVTASLVHAGADIDPYIIQQIESIDDRVRKEVQIAKALEEKEVLLREIHHRVKNNLQVIQSLLSLKRSSVTEPSARDALNETVQRVHAMALVHEKLYQSVQLSDVDLADYLKDLMVQLQHALDTRQRVRICWQTTREVRLDLNRTISVGLMFTELVSNSLKHAFKTNPSPSLTFDLSTAEDVATLRIQDNGCGVPDDVDLFQSRSLGLRLVVSLARQMDAHLQVHHGAGLGYALSFSIATAPTTAST